MADKPEEKLTVEEKTMKAKELYGMGSRNYYVKSYSEAADNLSDATELYANIYGVDGEELGEVYLLYAKALIAVAREENKLMDIQEVEDEDDDENEEECAEDDSKDPEKLAENDSKDPEKLAENESKDPEKLSENESKDPEKVAENESKDAEKPTENESNDPDENMKDPEEKPKESEVNSKDSESELKNLETVKVLTNGCHSDDAKDPEKQAGPTDENNPAETDEDPSNLEVAWEVLQNAAAIFQRQNEKGLSHLLDVYNEMAGISIENENFSVALEDYARALATFDKIEDSQKNQRIAAEIHYRVGLCLTLEKSFDESIKSFQKAHDLLSDVIEKEKSKEQTDEVVANIKDMEETKQEILNKINETGDIKADEVENIKKELAKICSKMNGTADSSKDQQSSEGASDISHLIKRKKPDVTDSNVESSPAKKQVIEADEAIKAVPADDEKKMIEEEESVQPAVEN